MKRYLFFVFLLLLPLIAWALVTTIISGGNWNNPSNWDAFNVGDLISEDVVMNNNLGADVIVQAGDAYIIGTLDLQNGNTLVIEAGGSLILGSNVVSKNLSGGNTIIINASGNLEIWGDITLTNDLIINVAGTLTIHGDLNGGNDAMVSVTGTLNVDGDIDVGNNSTLSGSGTINLSGTCTGPDSFCDSGPLFIPPPVISDCPLDINVSLTGVGCDEIVNWTEPTATDKNGIASFTTTHDPGEVFALGITTVTYTAVNLDGKTATCVFDIKVSDDTFPVITNCPSDIIVSISGDGCEEKIVWSAPEATDNCSVTSFVSSHNPGDDFPVGVTVVSYTAIDQSGKTTICDFSVTVNDNTGPVIAGCPTNKVINTSFYDDCDAVVTWSLPVATDNCAVNSFTSTHNSGDVFPIGTTTVIYTAIDMSGNTTECGFDVIVNDLIPPVFDFCPTEVVVAEFNLITQTAVVTWVEPLASDNCTIPVVTSNFKSGDEFPAGKTIVEYTAIDKSDNVDKCQFLVEVVGNEVPVSSPLRVATYSGEPLDICLKVEDPDGNKLVILEVNDDNLNGIIEPLEKDGRLCFTYTSFDNFQGEETIIVVVCDDGTPNACIKVEVTVAVTLDLNLTFYKAFTPNSDNINDVWAIGNIENYPNNHVMIYDRLGGLIYSARGYDNVNVFWDGRSNQDGNDKVASGTYYYKIDLGNDAAPPKGFIELIR